MIYYIAFVVIYIGVILFIRPTPNSFRDKPISIKENFLAIKGSLILGTLLLSIHFFVSDFTFLEINSDIFHLLALNNYENNYLLIFQFFTHIFIHLNLMHLVGNVFMLGLLSAYERRVGVRRFLVVFIVSGLFSGLSIFFYDEKIFNAGASGAIFGIGAAFFTDEKNLTHKDWIYAVFLFIFLATLISFKDYFDMQKIKNINFDIDYIGHALGALGALIYTRLFRVKE